MSDPSTSPAPPDAEPVARHRPAESLQEGSMGAHHITAMVIASAAPIAGVAGTIPLAIFLGNGVGTPGAIFLVAILLALFSVGYVRIIPHIRNAGAFYAYIAQGLGRPAGVASAYVILVCYLALGCSIAGGFGYFAKDLIYRFAGLVVPWPACALASTALAAVLAWYGVTLAARLLLIVLALEVVSLFVVDVAIVVERGFGAFSLDAISPHVVFSGSIGLAAVYGFSNFLGFEGTAIYVEEAKQPLRTVPRATYAVVAVVGLFYGISAWAIIAGAGADQVVARAADNPGHLVFGIASEYVGEAWSDLLSVLVVVSLFAGVLAFMNASARYFFALSRDGVLPTVLSHVDRRHRTPMPAIALSAAVIAAVVVVFAAAGLDPLLSLTTSMVGLGTVGLVALLAVASVAVATFFIRKGDRRFVVTVAPILAAVLLAACTVAGIDNIAALTGTDSAIFNHLPWIHLVVAVIGFLVALRVRARDRQRYELLGSTRV